MSHSGIGVGGRGGDRSPKHVTTESTASLRPTAGTDSYENSGPTSSHGMSHSGVGVGGG